jgi:hypothetical protein
MVTFASIYSSFVGISGVDQSSGKTYKVIRLGLLVTVNRSCIVMAWDRWELLFLEEVLVLTLKLILTGNFNFLGIFQEILGLQQLKSRILHMMI